MKDLVYTSLLLAIIAVGHILGNANKADITLVDTRLVPREALADANTLSLQVSPQEVMPGEPFLAIVQGVSATSSVRHVTFNGMRLGVFEYNKNVAALAGTELEQKSGEYTITAELVDGNTLSSTVVIKKRPRIEAPLGIPEKLGGNTKESQQQLVTTLVNEAAVLRSLQSASEVYWQGEFEYPIRTPYITDTYGYSRQTGSYSIAHKGTDFRAPEGTDVFAMNNGVVRLVRDFRNYGKTVVVDHGQGIMTLYLHLSSVLVSEGQYVAKGQAIAKSGSTGYANGAHLHLSVKVNSISIDPIKFLELL